MRQDCVRCGVSRADTGFTHISYCRICWNKYQQQRRLAARTTPEPRICGFCRGAYQPKQRQPKSMYCSPRCKNAAHIAVDSAARKLAKANRQCGICGKSIADKKADAKWCSSTCANKRTEVKATRRRSRLKTIYGITAELYDAMLEKQRGRCAVCRSADPKAPHQGRFAVDHDHVTGQVRGLLCTSCNTGIGQLQDDPDLIASAAAYVRKHRQLILPLVA